MVGMKRETFSPNLPDLLALSEEDAQISGVALLSTTLSPGWGALAMAEPIVGGWGGM